MDSDNQNQDIPLSSNASSEDGDELNSSIEALNWSDIEEELDEGQLTSGLAGFASLENSQNGTETLTQAQDKVPELVAQVTTLPVEEALPTPSPHVNVREMVTEGKAMDKKELEYGTVDQTSNLPVLDDGPIWSKGSKKYRFEENRPINRKLTFGVIISLVLAIGLGLGNLVAYNECEEEHKVRAMECPCSTEEHRDTILRRTPFTHTHNMFERSSSTPFMSAPKPEQILPVPLIPAASLAFQREQKPDPKLNQKYAFHARELSRVIKLLDELSQKLDKFENTTRQLDGIVVLKEEVVKKELVEIARGVLEAVEESRLPIIENEKLQHTGVFPIVDEVEPKSVPIQLALIPNSQSTRTQPLAADEVPASVLNSREHDRKRQKREKRQLKFDLEFQEVRGQKKFKRQKNVSKEPKDSEFQETKVQKKIKRQRNLSKAPEGSEFQEAKVQKKLKHQKNVSQNSVTIKSKNVKNPKPDSPPNYQQENKQHFPHIQRNKNKVRGQGQDPESDWGTVRAKERKEARRREAETRNRKVKNWYFERARGRENSRH